MKKNMKSDQPFKMLLMESRREMPFPDFEDEVMMQIDQLEAKEELLREGYQSGITYSWIFFAAGVVLGVILTLFIPHFEFHFIGAEPGVIQLLFQVGFILFVLLHFEKLLSMTRLLKKSG
jgi:hypothetical protein